MCIRSVLKINRGRVYTDNPEFVLVFNPQLEKTIFSKPYGMGFPKKIVGHAAPGLSLPRIFRRKNSQIWLKLGKFGLTH